MHIRFARLHFPYAILAVLFLGVLEFLFTDTPPHLILLWVLPLLSCKLIAVWVTSRYLKTKAIILRKIFFVFESLSFICWLGYLYILGMHSATELEIVWRGFILFIITALYLNGMQYSMSFLIANTSITCLGILIYLIGFAELPVSSQFRYIMILTFGWIILVHFGRSAYLLVCENFAQNKQLITELDNLVSHDTLTEQYSRRYFDEQLIRYTDMYHRNQRPFCLAILDIDYFKFVNDNYGHQVGDTVLIQLGRLVKSSLRITDIFARYGGEEFALILPETNTESAREVLEKVRSNVQQHIFDIEGELIRLTVSIGAMTARSGITPKKIIHKADDALYKAKKHGRNQVQMAE